LVDLKEFGIRSYVSEPQRGRRNWIGKQEERDAVYANRRRIRGNRGKSLLRRRGLMLERPFAHCYETGRMRRTYLRGRQNILKRLLIHIAGFNLSLVLRLITGKGTPRGLQDLALAYFLTLIALMKRFWQVLEVRISIVTVGMAESRPTPFSNSDFKFGTTVAVGTTVARRPPHGSVRAGLLHTALTLDA
jgi:transposase